MSIIHDLNHSINYDFSLLLKHTDKRLHFLGQDYKTGKQMNGSLFHLVAYKVDLTYKYAMDSGLKMLIFYITKTNIFSRAFFNHVDFSVLMLNLVAWLSSRKKQIRS